LLQTRSLLTPTLAATVDLNSVDEGIGSVVVVITLSEPSNDPLAINCQTSDGTAIAGQDYTSYNSSVPVGVGVTLTQISIDITDDTLVDANASESFTVTVSLASDSTVMASVTINIDDNDTDSETDTDNQSPNVYVVDYRVWSGAIGGEGLGCVDQGRSISVNKMSWL